MLSTRLHVTVYERRHRRALLNLTWSSPWTHKHLDWYGTGQWIDRDEVLIVLAWDGDQLVGYLGLSPPLEGHCWVRLLGISSGSMPGAIVRELWQHAETYCKQRKVSTVLMLMASSWCSKYMPRLGFAYLDDIITLNHFGALTTPLSPLSINVISAENEHLMEIAEIDRQSFLPPWHLSTRDLRHALRIAANTTVAVLGGKIAGYQISTRHDEVVHLARLAVLPAHQGSGVGTALLAQLLDNSSRQGINTVSVNTQLTNLPSQRLYQRLGFIRSGFDIEVWQKPLS